MPFGIADSAAERAPLVNVGAGQGAGGRNASVLDAKPHVPYRIGDVVIRTCISLHRRLERCQVVGRRLGALDTARVGGRVNVTQLDSPCGILPLVGQALRLFLIRVPCYPDLFAVVVTVFESPLTRPLDESSHLGSRLELSAFAGSW